MLSGAAVRTSESQSSIARCSSCQRELLGVRHREGAITCDEAGKMHGPGQYVQRLDHLIQDAESERLRRSDELGSEHQAHRPRMANLLDELHRGTAARDYPPVDLRQAELGRSAAHSEVGT